VIATAWATAWATAKNRAKHYCTLWLDLIWRDCCRQHDEDYSAKAGGPTRWHSDLDLAACVWASSWSPSLGPVQRWLVRANAVLMFCGVRSFGWLFWHGRR